MAGNDLISAPLGSGPARRPGPGARPVQADVIDVEFSEAATLHVRDYVHIVYKYRWLAGTCFVLTFGAALVLTLAAGRTYTATTHLQVSRQSPIQLQLQENVLRVDDDDRNAMGMSAFLGTQMAVLRSRDLAERVIRTHHLDSGDALAGASERVGLLALSGRLVNMLRPRGWQSDERSEPAAPSLAPAGSIAPKLINRYLRYLSVAEVRGTDLVAITLTTPSPTLSAFLAAAHAQAYIEANEEARLVTNTTAKAFLGEQLRESRARIDRAEGGLRAFAAEHPRVAIDHEHKLIGARIADLSSQLTKVEGQRLALETRYEFLSRPQADALAFFLDRPGVQKLRLTLLDLETQRAALADRLGTSHPDMIQLEHQGDTVRRQLRSEISRETDAVRARHDAFMLRESRLRAKLQQQEDAALDLQALGVRYELLAKEAETARALRDSLLKQQMETSVNSELAPLNIRVVDRAEVPERPTKPNVRLNLTLGLLVGLLFAVGSTLLCEYFDNSVKSSEEVETLLRLPTLAVIPRFYRQPVSSNGGGLPARAEDLVVRHEPRSLVAEAFRTMRTAVLFSTPGAPPRVIVITSAGAGEGKTMTSLNLVTTLVDSGSRVLLVDADLRRPSCHRAFGLGNDNGLSRFLAGHAALDDVVRRVEEPRLDFIPAGPTPPNPAELVGSTRMRETLGRLREDYDFVIVDSPPSLPVTDAVLLGREADGVVLVVKGHDTPRELVKRARDQLAQSGAHLLGVLVNNVNSGWGALYQYRRYYGGYYGYGGPPPTAGEDQRA